MRLTAFLLTFVGLLVATSWFTQRYQSECMAPEAPLVTATQAVVFSNLPESDRVLVKLKLLGKRPAPQVGIFGNHVVMMMRAADAEGYGSFYNYTVPHVTAEEMVEYLAYVKSNFGLPKYVFIGITDPNHGNGENTLGYQWKMHDLVYTSSGAPSLDDVSGYAKIMDKKFTHWFERHFDYQSILHSVSNLYYGSCGASLRYVNDDGAPQHLYTVGENVGQKGLELSKLLPRTMSKLFQETKFENFAHIEAIRDDGSFLVTDRKPMVPYVVDFNEPNVLRAADVPSLAATLRQQAHLVEAAGSHPIFFVVPRYQIRSKPTTADEIVKAALQQAGGLQVLDMSDLADHPEMFEDAPHPGGAFFKALLARAHEKGWLQ